MVYRFVRWGEGRRFAILYNTDTREYVSVPFSRLIPHPACESSMRAKGISDPNMIAVLCTEMGSVFGPAVYRHELHLDLAYRNTLTREREKEYFFPATIDFSCVRERIVKGESTDTAIRECS